MVVKVETPGRQIDKVEAAGENEHQGDQEADRALDKRKAGGCPGVLLRTSILQAIVDVDKLRRQIGTKGTKVEQSRCQVKQVR
jgi:hypothetical protein